MDAHGWGGLVIAHGVDLCEVARVRAMLERHGERFRDRVFTAEELAYARGARREAEHLAARFAAKEAVFKALGTGWAGGVTWLDCAVVRSASGAPGVRLSGRAARVAESLGIGVWVLSLSHTGGMAMASVIGLSAGSGSGSGPGSGSGEVGFSAPY